MFLYKQHRASLPCHRNRRTSNNPKIIRLEALRSDDFPDIEKGLNDFYSELLNIRENKNEKIPHGMKKEFLKIITNVLSSTAKDPFEPLKEDHFKVLEAIDDYEVEFGERQKVKSLMRCNIRSKWNNISKGTVPCKKCWQPKNKKAFLRGLLECCQNLKPVVDNDQYGRLNNYDYESIMSLAETEFTKRLENASKHSPSNTLHFLGLQRWNSLTPAQGRSVGGGYFLYRTDEDRIVDLGIAIDPGFDFVRNFLRSGFSIRDINFILISHAHADHLWDFESIVQLLKELDEKRHIKHRINVILTLSAYEKFERHIIRNTALREFIEPYVIDVGKAIDPHFFDKLGIDHNCTTGKKACVKQENLCFRFWRAENGTRNNRNSQWWWKPVLPSYNESAEVEIWPTCAYHDDYSNISDSFGFIIRIKQKEETPFVFGYTGDTRWVGDELYNKECHYYRHPDKRCKNKNNIQVHWTNVAKQYEACNALLVHMGSLIDHKKGRKFKNYESQSDCDQLIRDKNHPYLMGMIRLLGNIYRYKRKKVDKLVLVGEFGEELRGGIRVNVVSRLQAALTPGWPVIPVDVGLDIVLTKPKNGENGGYDFICALCDKSRSIGNKNKQGLFESKIEYHCYGHDEAIFYICDTCYKSIPEDVRQNRLRQLYETGRELKTGA
jgi:ribonuclease BN (tRNA processing enzyme)